MSHKVPECIPTVAKVLESANSDADWLDDAYALRRISMTLHTWHEKECGDGRGCIERDEDENGNPVGPPYWHLSPRYGETRERRWAIPDKEKGALKRLAAIMQRYPSLRAYVQGDPRGCALFILRPGDVPDGADVNGYYTRGIAVYK